MFILKGSTRQEVSVMKNLLDEERYRSERLEEQINDLTELHQNEMTNLRQVTRQRVGQKKCNWWMHTLITKSAEVQPSIACAIKV